MSDLRKMTFNETMKALYDVCGGYAARASWKGRWIWMECYSSDLEDHVLFMEFFNRGITDYSPSDEEVNDFSIEKEDYFDLGRNCKEYHGRPVTQDIVDRLLEIAGVVNG